MAQYSTSVLRTLWQRYRCQTGGEWAHPLIFGHPIGGVPTVLVPAYRALEQALDVTGYHPPDKCLSAWAYNCRMIAGTDSYSLHSYGIAIDLDPTKNPYSAGDPYSGWLKKSHVDAVLGIRTTTGKALWSWGGNWGTPDRMHFQIDNSPTDCQPDWATVPNDEEDDDDMPSAAEIAAEVVKQLNAEGVKLARSDYNSQTLFANTIGQADKEPKGSSIGAEVKKILGIVSEK